MGIKKLSSEQTLNILRDKLSREGVLIHLQDRGNVVMLSICIKNEVYTMRGQMGEFRNRRLLDARIIRLRNMASK